MEYLPNTTTILNTTACNPQDYYPLLRFRQCILAIALVLKALTLIPILCHSKLHRQRYIFPINLFAADLLGILTYPISDILLSTSLHNKVELEDYVYNWSICISSSTSNMSIFMVSVYQLITIIIDPFSVTGMITTPRCLLACAITWAATIGLGTVYTTFDTSGLLYLVVGINFLITVATGLCYLYTFHAISKTSSTLARGRREENRQVLRTLGVVYGTNLLAFSCIAALHVYIALSNLEEQTPCHRLPVLYSIEIVFIVDWLGNTMVYWWRLRDFRAFYKRCGLLKNNVEPFQTNFDFSSVGNVSMTHVRQKRNEHPAHVNTSDSQH